MTKEALLEKQRLEFIELNRKLNNESAMALVLVHFSLAVLKRTLSYTGSAKPV